MSFRLRIFMLAVLPFLMVTGAVTWISFKEVSSLSAEQIRIFGEKLRSSKESSLKDYIDLALTAIAPILQNSSLDEKTAQREVKRILNGLSYGRDGYFFVYDSRGVNLVHPIQAELVGRNLYNKQDKRGDQVIKELLEIANNGGGFHQYYWNKPSTHTDEQKIAYVVRLPRWEWILGSGLYIDDISNEEEVIRQQVDDNIKRNIIIILAIIVVTTLLIVLLMIVINLHEGRLANRRLRKLAQNFVKLQIQERRHFSRELHDGINQLMVAVKFRVELAMKQITKERSSGNELESLAQGLNILKEAIKEVRRISHALRPGLLDEMGLEIALHDLLDQFQERTGITIKRGLSLNSILRLPDDVEITLYRVIQEALTNVERHAHAANVTIALVQEDTCVKLMVQDDGHGFSPNAQPLSAAAGIGLINMRERVELLGGDFSLESTPGQVTRLYTTLPYSLPAR